MQRRADDLRALFQGNDHRRGDADADHADPEGLRQHGHGHAPAWNAESLEHGEFPDTRRRGGIKGLAGDHGADEQAERGRQSQGDAGLGFRQPVHARPQREFIPRERRHFRIVAQALDNRRGICLMLAFGQNIGGLIGKQPQQRPGRGQRTEDIRTRQAVHALDNADHAHALSGDLGDVADALDAEAAKVGFIHDNGARLRKPRPQLRGQLLDRTQRVLLESRANHHAQFEAAAGLVPVGESLQIMLQLRNSGLTGDAQQIAVRHRPAEIDTQYLRRANPDVGPGVVHGN